MESVDYAPIANHEELIEDNQTQRENAILDRIVHEMNTNPNWADKARQEIGNSKPSYTGFEGE